MSENKQETYSEEFKESSVKLALETNQPYAQTARELGVKLPTMYAWIKKYSPPSKNNVSVQVNPSTPNF